MAVNSNPTAAECPIFRELSHHGRTLHQWVPGSNPDVCTLRTPSVSRGSVFFRVLFPPPLFMNTSTLYSACLNLTGPVLGHLDSDEIGREVCGNVLGKAAFDVVNHDRIRKSDRMGLSGTDGQFHLFNHLSDVVHQDLSERQLDSAT
jgi:hypothetical protein